MRFWRDLGAVLSAAAILAGCGSGAPSSGTANTPTAKKPGNPADELARTMVSAVPASKGASFPVQVKFHLRGRPDVGQPVTVDLMLLPTTASIDRITGKVVAEEGLELVDGADIGPIERPQGSAALSHSLRLRPQHNGVFTFTAVLTVDSGGQSTSQAFLMPLIAGAGVPQSPAVNPGQSQAPAGQSPVSPGPSAAGPPKPLPARAAAQ